MTVVGVDGWKRGWIAAVAAGRRIEWQPYERFDDLLARHDDAVVAVDMPIAIADEPRDADLAARRWLSERGGTWSSIFLAPPAAAVRAFEGEHTHAEAMFGVPTGSKTSIQAWNLIPKIVEVRDALAARPDARLIEAHPECSFRAMDESIGRTSKKTGRGAGLRIRALSREFELDLADAPADVPVDDLLDACAVAWTAARYERGDHLVLPDGATDPPRIVI